MSTQQVTSSKTSTNTRTKPVIIGFTVNGYSGIVNVYAVIDGNVASFQRVEIEDGQPIQVRLDLPQDTQYARIIVTDEKDQNVLIDKTVMLPSNNKIELGKLDTMIAVGVQDTQQGGVSAGLSQDQQQLLQQLAQEIQELDALKQQVNQIQQATITALSQED
ncbi:MAG: hypothetical protein JHC26_05280 [Thermofilum sp.]|jgi:hypothetical protein|uniref:hypothetical protein n=1 Tax=Thermofilum sp. TaxID=1961369 RepID=UPI002582F407|nr:hypothetical protein [Thermofilum sp.]MCI4408483.1 hypothetical protein [Thermofilum sp.]